MDVSEAWVEQVSHGLRSCREKALTLAEFLLEMYQKSRTVLVAGNGGSASTAGHFAQDLQRVCPTSALGDGLDYHNGYSVLSLCENQAMLSGLANDLGFEQVFADQLRAHAEARDVLILFSVSGTSPNIMRATEAAGEMGVRIVAFTGKLDPGTGPQADIHIEVPYENHGIVESVHSALAHLVVSGLNGMLARVFSRAERNRERRRRHGLNEAG